MEEFWDNFWENFMLLLRENLEFSFGVIRNFWKKLDEIDKSIVKSIRSISQKSKFYRRAVTKFLYIMRNQCGMLYSLYWEYELKILRVSVKLAYLSIYFTKKHAWWRLTWLTICWDCNISGFFRPLGLNTAKIIDYIEKCFKRKLRRIKFPVKNSGKQIFISPRSRATVRQTFAIYWN